MSNKKEAVEIECPRCTTRFRLWIPARLIAEWEAGHQMGCITCRAGLKVTKESGAFVVSPMEEDTAAENGKDKVLFIDDDKLIREMAEEALQESETVPILAKNSSEALDVLNSNSVSLIVIDLHLKNPNDPHSTMDGEEFLWKVKDMNIGIPSIITTGKELIDDIIMDTKWIELNVKGFIQKGNPFWTDELKAKIHELLFKD
ncbi:MAG: response regulator [Thermodesulfobacteriota bacterium]